jgi:hypothetical protein
MLKKLTSYENKVIGRNTAHLAEGADPFFESGRITDRREEIPIKVGYVLKKLGIDISAEALPLDLAPSFSDPRDGARKFSPIAARLSAVDCEIKRLKDLH